MTAPIEVRPACRKAAISTETLRTNLGLVVGELQALHRCASQARYRLTGAETPGLRLHLDGVVWTVHHATGTIAERLRALDAGADRLAVTAATTAAIDGRSTGEAISGAALPIVIREILAVVDTIGPIRALLDATDLSTAELSGAMTDVLREQASTRQRESVERRVSPPNPAPAPVAVNSDT